MGKPPEPGKFIGDMWTDQPLDPRRPFHASTNDFYVWSGNRWVHSSEDIEYRIEADK